VGRWLDNLAAQLREDTPAHISLYAPDGQVLASTFSQPLALTSDEAAEVFSSELGSYTRALAVGTAQYNEVRAPWQVRASQPVGILGVALSSTPLVQASQLNRGSAAVLLLAAFFSVVVMGLVIANRITRPISRLKSAAQQVAGGDLKVNVPTGGGDEIGVLAQSFNDMVKSVSRSKQDLMDAYEKTIEGWARATDLRDHETEGHSRRVTELAVALAASMGFSGQDLVHLRRGALLHDIGKIAISDAILHKPGPLTDAERNEMKKHPLYARQFMEQIEFLKPALQIPYYHHEKWDGSGYPEGLKGEQIPLGARVFAIVDVWDALTSDRPYRDALSFDDTLKHILKESGTHFDPQVVEAFKKMMGR
jgi:putative nucleotidyltransferase with HDIG domain